MEERRARRRAERSAANRDDILDAAEHVFGERGLDGSLRDIAHRSGFSTAAIYTYFENKDHLFAEALARRGGGLLDAIEMAAKSDRDPLMCLHAIVDATTTYFATYPSFRRMLGHVRTPGPTMPSIGTGYAAEQIAAFGKVSELMLRLVARGQSAGVIRKGPPAALLHFYESLVYEQVFLAADGAALSDAEFHDLIDGALRPTPKR